MIKTKEDLEKFLGEARSEDASVDEELRRRKDMVDKSRKRYEAMLDELGLTEEDVFALAQSENVHPEAKAMMARARDEARRVEQGGQADGDEAPEDQPKKRKKRMIVKM